MRIAEPEDFSTMARTAARGFWSQVRARVRTVRRCLAAGVVFALLAVPTFSSAQQAQPDPVKGEASFSTSGGYARLTIKLAEDVASQVTSAGSILVIRFERPVDLSADRLAESALDYVSSARRDPDGTAIRLSLARRVTINTISAGERTFVDLLPDGWTGPQPPLPIEVVRELAERARAAERALRQQRAESAAKKRPPVRVRALMQPTFVRFVFEMPDGVGASSIFNDQKLTLSFNGLLTFDLADALVAAPPNIASIKQRVEGDNTLVEIEMIGDVDVHSFREDKNYNIDVAFQQPDRAKVQALPAADASHAPAPAAAIPKKEAAGEKHAEEITPPTSDTIARQMKAESKAEKPAATETPKAEAAADGMRAAETPREIAKETAKEAAKETVKAEGAAEQPGRAAEAAKPEMSAPAAEASRSSEAPAKMASTAPSADQAMPAMKPDAKPAMKSE